MLTRRCAVLGKPIAHSLSPVLHRAAYDVLGLDWTYDAIEMDEVGLAGFVQGLDDSWRGLSLTMPLKREVYPLLDVVRPWAELGQAANTVVIDGGALVGDNTDIPGAQAAVRERFTAAVEDVVVFGGGATAASVLLAMAELGCRQATLVVRSLARAQETVDAVRRHPQAPDVVVVEQPPQRTADLLVCTIPASAQTATHLRCAAQAKAVFDVIYHPWPTPVAAQAQAQDQVLIGGLDLLVHQAALQVELMTAGQRPTPVVAAELVPAMRAAGHAALLGEDDRLAQHRGGTDGLG